MNDEPLLPAHEWVRWQSGWRYLEFTSGHDAMVLHPDALTEVLISGAANDFVFPLLRYQWG
jgi:hypothetical protein